VANNPQYISSILKDGKVLYELEQLSFEDRFNEYIMTSLRTMWGADLEYISKNFGVDVMTALTEQNKEYEDKGWILISSDKLVLTAKGKLFADRIASELFLIK
jgi:oxygen-independent coproporphyrinogen-3 oxidase